MNIPTSKKRILPLLALSASWSLVFAPSLQAQTAQTWNNGATTGLWNLTDANWSGSVWTNNNNAVFGTTSGITVTASTGVVVNDMTFSTAGYTIAGSLKLANDLASTVSVTVGTATISANIFNNDLGASSLTKSGAGTLVLSGSNSYSGGTVLSAGILAINNANALGTGTFTISGGSLANTSGGDVALATNNVQLWTNSFTYAGSNTLNLGTGAVTLNVNDQVTVNSGNLIVGGVISGASSSYGITKAGAGTLTLNGLNNYGFATIVTGGTLAVNTLANGGVASSIGAETTAANWALQLKNGAALVYTGAGSSTNRSMNIDTAGIIDNEGTGALMFSNTVGVIGNNADATGTANKTITLTGINALNNTIALKIANPTTGKTTSLVKSGIGFWALTNAASTYSGTTTINAGVLSAQTMANGGSASSIGSSTSDAANLVLAGGTFQYTGSAVSTDRLFTVTTSGGGVDGSGGGISFTNTGALSMSGAGARTLTLKGTSASNSLAAQIQDNGGATSLVKNGSGGWTLSGSNSYSGGTTLTSGQITVGNANALGTGTLTIAGGVLATASGTSISLATNNAIVWSGDFTYGGGTLNLGTGAVAMTTSHSLALSSGNLIIGGVISGVGYNVSKSGSGLLTLTGSNTFTGALVVSSGSVAVNSLANGGVPSSIGAGPNSAWALQLINGATLVYTGTGSTTDRQMDIDTAGTIDNEGTGALVFSNSGGSLFNNINAAGLSNKTITLTGTNADANTMALKIADPTAGKTTTLVKDGSGYWSIAGTGNTYSGTTSVQNGTLAFSSAASGTAAQSLGSGNTVNLGVAATSSGTLQYTGIAGTLDKTIYALGNGLNTIKNSGSGLLTLSGSLVKNGTILALDGGSSGINVTGTISGSSSNSDLYVTGGTTTLTAANTYNGPTWVYGGGVLVNGNASGALPAATTLILGGVDNSNGTFDLNGNGQTVAGLSSQGGGTNLVLNNGASTAWLTVANGGTFSGSIKDGASATALAVTGGSLILAGNNSYTGATTVSAGELDVNGSISNSAVTVSIGATLAGSGTASGTVSVNSATINGSGLHLGATTFTGESTLSGTTAASSIAISNGTTTVSGTTSTTSGLTVSSGAILKLNGSLGGTASVSGTLGGNGTITGATTIQGTLAAGDSIGTLNTGNLTLASTSTLDVELGRNGTTPTSDLTNVTGTVDIASGANLKLTLSTGLSDLVKDDIIFLIDNDGTDAVLGVFTSLNGATTTLTEGSKFAWNSQWFEITYKADSTATSFTGGNDVALMVVPEPSTWTMIFGGIGMLLGMQGAFRRKA